VELGWWSLPVTLLAVWVVVGTAFSVRTLLSGAAEIGLMQAAPGWLHPEPSAAAYWSGMLAQLGMLGGEDLQWARETESLTRNVLSPLLWQAALALLYLSWIAIWWTRHARPGHGQPLEARNGITVE
jgi:hypothetical protein